MGWLSKSKKNVDDDDILLRRYRETGDLAVLAALFDAHAEMVYYVCMRYLQDSERSKDAVMQIFEELIHKVNKQDIQKFGSWLYVLSRNHCLMQLRSEKNRQQISIDEFVEFPLPVHPEDDVEEKERQLSQLERCMERLPEKQKRSVDLFYLNEKCYKEIAEITGYSMNEVKSYIQNGKRNLKLCMEGSDAKR
ncbi:RNA polymerase sigma factor [Parapedobacter indicus]|uniref:RNA polymerase sigma-70 factor, ECF subfamily n=1 Tax=Parapedobacter indicus TaxID=1477437 RepID=A0A1I3QQM7_9SPHI|nr:sigma-70 family RNA polymerase sigma factor [Parapedobacter indicus]PPL00186.1 RNA polymerase sigma-70 factor (ECF subfamily) [Parapedobacter indicus]SFJ35591.1 RNA polymerase sigma-70 factor, ECF subfamily [Parapedobacter indicus]